MRDLFEVIRDVQMPATQGRGQQPVGIEAAAEIVTALNKEGYVILAANWVKIEPAPTEQS